MLVRTAKELGAAMRDRRRSLGLDQKTLAARVGVSRQWIVAVERGKDRADLTLVLRALDALGLRLDVAAGDAGQSERESDAGAFLTTASLSTPDIDAIVDAARQPPVRPMTIGPTRERATKRNESRR